MNKKLNRLLEPSMLLFFLCLVVFAACSARFSPALAAGEGVVILVLFFYYQHAKARRKREALRFLTNMTTDVDAAKQDTALNAPLAMVIFRPDSGEVIWSNDRFLQLTGEREHLFDTRITTAVPAFSAKWLMDGRSECPTEVPVGDRRFLVFGNLVRTGDSARGLLATTYWVDVTELAALRDEFHSTRPVVALITIDNYEELIKGISDNNRSAVKAEVNQRLTDWAAPADGLMCQTDRDRYLFIFEEKTLPTFLEGKFSILDDVRQVKNEKGLAATLSIGVGKDGVSFGELFQFANLSVEMALSRGGDQAVIRNKFNFEYYGGKSRETEKRTKVKSRVMANALGQLVQDSSRVFVMGHKYPDLDCIGAAAGVCAIAREKGVPAFILQDGAPSPSDGMARRLGNLPEYARAFLSPQDAIVLADSRSLLVVVDTNRPEQVLSQDLLLSCNRVAVIDHHRRAATYIADYALSYHEPYASSASELVTELLQNLVEPTDLLRGEAEALLAGIVLDTKNFTLRTGGRTFEAAAFLRRSGADTAEIKKLFQGNLNGVVARCEIIKNAKMLGHGIALAVADHGVDRVLAAQAADELLNVSGVEASFVVAPDEEKVVICARAIGNINVQVILEKLGGGGNADTAGAQIPGRDPMDVERDLLAAIDQYFEDA